MKISQLFKQFQAPLLLVTAVLVFSGCLAAEKVEEINCLANSWECVQTVILDGEGSCTNCHTGSGAGPNKVVLEYASYAEVVTNGKLSYGGMLVVNADPGAGTGDHATSMLWKKVSGDLTGTEGAQMPFGLPPISAASQQWIADWIDAGAPEFEVVP